MFRRERGRHVDPDRVFRQAQHLDGVVGRRQRRREQRDALKRLEPRAQEAGRHHIADAQNGVRSPRRGRVVGCRACPNDDLCIQDGVIAQDLDQFLEALQFKVGVQQTSYAQRVRIEVLRHRANGGLKGLCVFVRHGLEDTVRCRCVHKEVLGCLDQTFKRALHRLGRRLGGQAQVAQPQVRAVHAPCSIHEVVRLVHEHRQLPVQRLCQAPEQPVAVEEVVYVTHECIRPAHQFLAKVVGADAMAQRDVALGRGVQPSTGHGFLACRGKAVVEARGERAVIAVAGLVGVSAAFLLGDDRENPQAGVRCTRGTRRAGAQTVQRLERRDSSRALAGQVGQLVDPSPGHGPERREQGAHGLADPGWRLSHQAATTCCCAVHRLSEVSLTRPELAFREGKRLK